MTEPTLTPQDQADLDSLGIQLEGEDQPVQRCLLLIWQHVLSNVEAVGAEPIPVGVALKVVASWPWLTFQETARYHELYHEVLGRIEADLDKFIEANPDALAWTGTDDAEQNHGLYKDLLITWHRRLDVLEGAWRADNPESHIWVPVIADVRAFIFSANGLVGHLQAIGFQLADDEFQAALKEATGE